jgi:hypothetical protein
MNEYILTVQEESKFAGYDDGFADFDKFTFIKLFVSYPKGTRLKVTVEPYDREN